MTTTRADIAGWFKTGVEKNKTHMVVLCDTFDWGDYPTYFDSEEEARKCVADPGSMQKVMEVYWLGGDMDKQLNERRCFQYGPKPEPKP